MRLINRAAALIAGQRAVKAPLIFAALLMCAGYSTDASSLPFFARQIGRDCTYCHSSFPRLNEKGRIFRANGYRFEGDEWLEAKDLNMMPVSVEVEVEAAATKVKRNEVTYTSNDMVIESGELIAGGAFGKTGKLSSLLVLNISQTGKNDTGFSTTLHKAFVQANDLAGNEGAGLLNVRAGQWQIGLPFLSATDTPVGNRYLAESALDILTLDQGAIELNGALGDKEDGALIQMHRYSAGFARSNVNASSKMAGYYASYSALVEEFYHAGVLFRGGTEANGAVDTRFYKYALAASVDLGPVTIIAAHMASDRQFAPSYNDNLVEVVYKPIKTITADVRFEGLDTSKKKYVSAGTFMLRYYMLSNAYAQFEYRLRSDKDHVVGTNEREDKLRFIFAAVF